MNQQEIWDQEHANPHVLKQMDSTLPSSGVVKFWQWLLENPQYRCSIGLEIGCGKGRNVHWLASKGVHITGVDFSTTAIDYCA